MADYLIMGQKAFKDGMTEDQIKHQHPQFRAAFRQAKANFEKQNKPISTLKPEKVTHSDETFGWELSWNDLDAITRLAPYNILNQHEQTKVWAFALRKVVWERRSEIKKHKHAVQMVKTIWEGIMQKGYDDGILDEQDLRHYSYVPTQLREVE